MVNIFYGLKINSNKGKMYRFIFLFFMLFCSVSLVAQTDNVTRKRSERQTNPTTQARSSQQRSSSNQGNQQNKSARQEISSKSYSVNGVSFDMMFVKGGSFTMGATSEMKDPFDNEKPTHQVTLSTYSIGKTEVTQALWKAVMGNNPSKFKGDNRPVECVSWDDCKKFISKLNSMTGQNFRLPTEAEWEFAARGGNNSNHYQYSGSNNIGDVAWYDDNSGHTTHDVATKKPNELGIYDMGGNVYEWCSDGYSKYNNTHQANPTGPNSGSNRVFRGGSWYDDARYCRSSYRYCYNPGDRYGDLGFRLALSE